MFGDYDFQFMIGELAVGAQFTLPHIHVLVNNDCFGRIRHPQRGFNMDDCVQLSFDNVNSPRSTATALTMSATALTMLNFSKDWVAGRFAPSSPRITPRARAGKEVRGRRPLADHLGVGHQRVHGLQIGAITEFEELAEAVRYARPPSA